LAYFLLRSKLPSEEFTRELKNQITNLQEENQRLRESLMEANEARILAQTRLEEQKAFLEEAKTKLADTFKSLASEALAQNNQNFLLLAEEKFKALKIESVKDLDARKQAIEELLKPLNQMLGEYKTEVSKLDQKIEDLTRTQSQLQLETHRLANALKTPFARGNWAEMTLRRIVEITGMVPYCDFIEQKSEEVDGQRKRPDLIVRLPGGRKIAVDAKAPGAHYLEAIAVEDEAQRNELLQKHADDVKEHINKLGDKEYHRLADMPDFVVLFIPNDSFLSAALEKSPDLIEYAFQRNVVLSTPATLIALLKAIAYGWKQHEMVQAVRTIYERGKELCERIGIISEHLEKIGKGLYTAVSSYNDAVGSLERRLFSSARRFRDLGKYEREIIELEPIDQTLRLLTPPEKEQ